MAASKPTFLKVSSCLVIFFILELELLNGVVSLLPIQLSPNRLTPEISVVKLSAVEFPLSSTFYLVLSGFYFHSFRGVPAILLR